VRVPLLVLTSILSSGALLLRSGERIPITGPATRDGGRIVFRTAGGSLFSLPVEEIDFAATARDSSAAPEDVTARRPLSLKASPEEKRRLIAALEQNHAGTPPPAPPAVTPAPERAATADDEWSWRHRAGEHQESITRARENLELLIHRAEDLRAHITSLVSLGYKPSQFTYDTTELQNAIDQIPAATLEVTRAERAYEQFRDEARQRGILPGWVR
jgi:hypothetical protein